MTSQRNWTRPEQLQLLRLYMRLPFGRLHSRNPEIIALANVIGRTPSAIAMKATNFASIDEEVTKTGRKGLSGASHGDRALWAEFKANPEAIAAEAEAVAGEMNLDGESHSENNPVDQLPFDSQHLLRPSESPQLIRVRRVQSFFRAAVLASYGSRCALSGIVLPELLTASHIIPWSVSVERRADPTNGLCLNALFDRAFDRGLIAFDENLRVLVSSRLQEQAGLALLPCNLHDIEGRCLDLPERFHPDRRALEHHRTTIFQE